MVLLDGYIIKIDNHKKQISKFNHSKQYCSYCFAYKEIQILSTVITEINININKDGIHIPIATITPTITYQNIQCNKINLYSYDFIKRNNINIGNKIQVTFNTIFVFYKNEDYVNSIPFCFSDNCNSCKSKLTIIGSHIYCTNINCSYRIINSLKIICTQVGMKNVAFTTITKLVQNKIIKNLLDLFQLEKYKDKIILIKGFSYQRINNILKEITILISKISVVHIVLCFGITGIGIKTANKICAELVNNNIQIQDIYNCSFLNKKQREEVKLFVNNKENIETVNKIINLLYKQKPNIANDNK